MESLGREYRKIRDSHKRTSRDATHRRHSEREMEQVAGRFEQLLNRWVDDETKHKEWLAFFYHFAAVPPEEAPSPPLFRGVTEVGASVEIHATDSGGYDVLVDRVHAERYDMPFQATAERFEPVIVANRLCRETFSASREAQDSLDAFLLRPNAHPPWRWARQLFEDGLIDVHFGLTPRGARWAAQRSSAGEAPATTSEARVANFCVLLANSNRARVFTLQTRTLEHGATSERVTEVADAVGAFGRARDHQLFSDSRPGLRRGGPRGPRHAVSDARERNRRKTTMQYDEHVAKVATQVASGFNACRLVVVASHPTLAVLRPVIAKRLKGRGHVTVREYAGDILWQDPTAIHEALALAGLLPKRSRRPPIRAMRTPNPWQGGS